MRWDEVAERVWLRAHCDLVERYSDVLDGITDPARLATAIGEREPELAGHGAAALARLLLTASLTLAFVRAGWHAEAPAGMPRRRPASRSASRGADDRVVPYDVAAALAAGETTPAEWCNRAAALGLEDVAAASRGA